MTRCWALLLGLLAGGCAYTVERVEFYQLKIFGVPVIQTITIGDLETETEDDDDTGTVD